MTENLSKNIVQVFDEVEPIYIKIALNILPLIMLEDEQLIIVESGLSHLKNLKKTNPSSLLSQLIDLFELINPFEYRCVFITKNICHRRKLDAKKYGKKATISFGDWTGNQLLIEDEIVDDKNRLVVYDGTKLMSETTPHLSGNKYNISFHNII